MITNSKNKIDLSPLLIPIKSIIIGFAAYGILNTGANIYNTIAHPAPTKVEVTDAEH